MDETRTQSVSEMLDTLSNSNGKAKNPEISVHLVREGAGANFEGALLKGKRPDWYGLRIPRYARQEIIGQNPNGQPVARVTPMPEQTVWFHSSDVLAISEAHETPQQAAAALNLPMDGPGGNRIVVPQMAPVAMKRKPH
jgi:hypothetical protein